MFRVTNVDESKTVLKAAEKANYKNLGHAAASLRKAAMALIRRGKKKSPPGQPPHTRKGNLRRAIVYDVDKRAEVAVIGPRASIVGASGMAHEFGGRYRGGTFPARPFMGPALEDNLARLGSQWQNSIGQ